MARTHHTRVGLHGRNHPRYHEIDYIVVRDARIETMKMMLYKPVDLGIYKRLRQINPQMEFIVRLGLDGMFDVRKHPGPAQFVEAVLPLMEVLRPYVTKFEIHNEPNHCELYEGWGPTEEDARHFRDWFLDVLHRLRDRAGWAKFGFPGLAPHHGGHDGDLRWIEICRPAVEASDWLGVHCYWQFENMMNPSWGFRFQKYHDLFPQKPIEITEFGDSTPDLDPERMAEEYAEYYAEVSRYPYLRSACAFMLSSPYREQWEHFCWRHEDGTVMPVVAAVGAVDRSPVVIAPDVLPPQEIPWIEGRVPLPDMEDVRDQLPKHGTDQYPGRTREAIKRIVIHHTVRDTTPEAVASYQVNRLGWPGIGYHFMIRADGHIWYTQTLGAQSRHTTRHNEDTVGIAFVGNFMQQTPTEAQIERGGHLCAFLLDQFGLNQADIVGRRELEPNIQSPGDQWLEGAKWKYMLLSRVDRYLRGGPISELEARLAQAERSLQTLRTAYQELTQEPDGIVPQLKARAAELGTQVKRLQAWLEAGGVPQIEPPEFEDISATLPQHETERYPERPREAIKRVIIHHTVTLAPPERIAAVQIRRYGWAGIGYHFIVMPDGTIYQTQPLTTVSHHTNKFNADAVGLALSGNFTDAPPPAVQLDAAAHLCAWLLGELGLGKSAVIGRNELEPVGSPGKQWLEGARYKEDFLARVQAWLDTAVPGDQALIRRLRAQIAALAEEREALKAQQDQLKAANASQKAEIRRLKGLIADREVEIQRLRDLLGQPGVRKPEIQVIIDQLEKHPTKQYTQRSGRITHIAIHHTDTPKDRTPQQIAHYHVWGKRYDKEGNLIKDEWPGIAYHYFVAADGTIYQCQKHETRSYHCGAANDYTLGIVLAGRFMRTDLRGNPAPPEDRLPTRPQLESVSRLVAWLMQELNVPLQNVVGHRELPEASTSCPGDQFLTGAAWKQVLHSYIIALQSGQPLPGEKTIPLLGSRR